MIALMISGRLVTRMDQRLMLASAACSTAVALLLMTHVTLGDGLLEPRVAALRAGLRHGLHLRAAADAGAGHHPDGAAANATAAFNVVRNIGGSIGVALVTTLLARRSQYHQATLVGHIDVWDPADDAKRLPVDHHFLAQGEDTFTARSRATAMLYRDTVAQAQVLAYVDEFHLLAIIFFAMLGLIPFMRRVDTRAPAPDKSGERVEGLREADEAPHGIAAVE